MQELKVLTVLPEQELVTTRVFNFPKQLVYRAWTDPEHLKKWWGPTGFTNTFHIFELKPGGRWSFIMHGPEGANYPNESVFVKIVENEQFVFNHVNNPLFQGDTTFESVSENETKVTYKMKFPTKEAYEKLRVFITGKNEENMDRLEIELKNMNQKI